MKERTLEDVQAEIRARQPERRNKAVTDMGERMAKRNQARRAEAKEKRKVTK